ncbi:collagen-like protein [Wolbachia endosymbiont (group E) of Neria commutata]|uniref:collagen-like triple helix repeat-containing protein n=1 Tax=Wolbachia endosymbiont (group E) of Neria commutata TaxID=3066149 RepID=UPI003132DFE1
MWDVGNKRELTRPVGSSEIICDPRNILTKDGRLIDVEEYNYGSTNKFLKFVPSWSKEVKVVRIDHIDGDDSTQDKQIGELPVVYPYFDAATSQIKFIGGGNVSDAAIKYVGADSGYFTIELKNGIQYGYFSDENGKPTSQSEYNKFPLPDIDPLQLTLPANIEELAQKNLELEECHSAALSTAQVKGKAISTVVNRVKRQVEEDETFKGDIKDLLKGDQSFKNSVRGEAGPAGPTGSQGVQGDRGFEGIPGATAEQVAKFLLTQKGNDLGKAVIDADSSNQHPLSSWLKNQLKGDQDFQENVADELLDRTNGNSIVSEVAKRMNKRSVEDRAVKKVTDKVDVQDVVDKVDQDKVIKELIEALGSNTTEAIIRNKIRGVRDTRFADKLVKEVGSDKAKDIVSDKITDPSLLIDKLLEKSSDLEQNVIAILTDPNNTGLIIKVFAEKYPEIDIESIIKNLQKPRAARDLNVRNSFKQGEEAAQQAEIAQKSAENARDEVKALPIKHRVLQKRPRQQKMHPLIHCMILPNATQI